MVVRITLPLLLLTVSIPHSGINFSNGRESLNLVNSIENCRDAHCNRDFFDKNLLNYLPQRDNIRIFNYDSKFVRPMTKFKKKSKKFKEIYVDNREQIKSKAYFPMSTRRDPKYS